ncbi:hypothetical protein Nepgr_026087 [Nepenthes gracilis]|uniref:Uncharacterized protein n=1 Tax=Nepenthes gracilis TaxID=150966 RepID=A0AAD3T8A9_NEPGR|nr:hypothetical protein Nepgr_026087 [Nepenthes gracilis]
MFPTKPLLYRHPSPVVNQVLAIMIQDRPFDAALAAATKVIISPWATEIVSKVLRATPRFFFRPLRSIGSQNNTVRHRPPLTQRNLRLESRKLRNGSTQSESVWVYPKRSSSFTGLNPISNSPITNPPSRRWPLSLLKLID